MQKFSFPGVTSPICYMPLDFVSTATIFWNVPYALLSHMVATIVPSTYLLPVDPLQLSQDVSLSHV